MRDTRAERKVPLLLTLALTLTLACTRELPVARVIIARVIARVGLGVIMTLRTAPVAAAADAPVGDRLDMLDREASAPDDAGRRVRPDRQPARAVGERRSDPVQLALLVLLWVVKAALQRGRRYDVEAQSRAAPDGVERGAERRDHLAPRARDGREAPEHAELAVGREGDDVRERL